MQGHKYNKVGNWNGIGDTADYLHRSEKGIIL